MIAYSLSFAGRSIVFYSYYFFFNFIVLLEHPIWPKLWEWQQVLLA
jgi:hypothetical protein